MCIVATPADGSPLLQVVPMVAHSCTVYWVIYCLTQVL